MYQKVAWAGGKKPSIMCMLNPNDGITKTSIKTIKNLIAFPP
jgi:hypothetical protein